MRALQLRFNEPEPPEPQRNLPWAASNISQEIPPLCKGRLGGVDQKVLYLPSPLLTKEGKPQRPYKTAIANPVQRDCFAEFTLSTFASLSVDSANVARNDNALRPPDLTG